MLHLFSEVLSLLLAFNNAFHRVSLVFFGAWYQHNFFFPSFSYSFKPFFSCFRCFARATGVFSTSTSFTPFSASQMFYSWRARNVCVFSCYQRDCSEWKNFSRLFFFCMQNFPVLLRVCTCSCTFKIHISKYKWLKYIPDIGKKFYLVNKMAVSWRSDWLSSDIICFFCQRQKLFRVRHASNEIWKPGWNQ